MNPIKLGIDEQTILGRGTHGTVYQSRFNSGIAVKVVKNESIRIPSCVSPNNPLNNPLSSICQLTNTEYIAQELVYEFLEKYLNNLPGHEIMRVPQVYGFSYSPSTLDPIYCSYKMEKILQLDDLPGLVQIPLGYDRNSFTSDWSGVYMGIDKIKDYFELNDEQMELIVKAIASFYALFHYGLGCDGYDTEFVLAPSVDDESILNVYALDFDKVSFYTGEYQYLSEEQDSGCLMRKIAEHDYEPRRIDSERDVVKLLATSFSYDPLPDYPEYDIWSQTYLEVAKQFNKADLAQSVLKFRRNFFC